jgi:hypothetical protein
MNADPDTEADPNKDPDPQHCLESGRIRRFFLKSLIL